MTDIQVENFSFSYPLSKTKALDHVSFHVMEGEFILLCGQSGCGKSTLLRQLKREIAAQGESDGEIFYKEKRLSEWDDKTSACEIGFVSQNPDNQIVTDKVWRELSFGLESLGLKSDVIRRRVAEMASFFGIHEWFLKSTDQLSGGQKQMLNLASVMVMQPRVLILDEPTSQLDPIAATDFIETIVKINREFGVTVILSEHRLEEVFARVDRVLVMDGGRMIVNESPDKACFHLVGPEVKHPMYKALPTPARIYAQVGGFEHSHRTPLTVREGRRWLSDFPVKPCTRKESPKQEKKTPLLFAKDIWFRYEKQLPDVLKGADISVYQGETYCLLGGNGTGKSTMLNTIAGLYKPQRGKITYNGKKLSEHKNLYRQNFASLPQNPQILFTQKTVELELNEMTHEKDKIWDIVKRMKLQDLLERHPYDLSGGEQQKAAFAKILLTCPAVIFLDEPTKGLDASFKIEFAAILKDLNQNGITIVMATHDIEFAAEYATRCGLFFNGQVVSENIPQIFFSGNNYYTTVANRMAGHIFEDAVTCEDVIELCKS